MDGVEDIHGDGAGAGVVKTILDDEEMLVGHERVVSPDAHRGGSAVIGAIVAAEHPAGVEVLSRVK